MERPETHTVRNRLLLFAVTLLAGVIASGGLGLAQGRNDRNDRSRSAVTNRLTGSYRLNHARSDNAATTAERVT